jgi:autotransporter translocation and assembly factor TamB
VAGTQWGFVVGALHAILFFLATLVIIVYLPIGALAWLEEWALGGLVVIAALIGGIVGGYSVRPRPK